jgi:hypothetical protein
MKLPPFFQVPLQAGKTRLISDDQDSPGKNPVMIKKWTRAKRYYLAPAVLVIASDMVGLCEFSFFHRFNK